MLATPLKKVAKAIYKVADAVEETFASGLNGDAFSALAGFGSIGIAAVELGVAESEVQGCDNWTPPSTQIPS